MSARPPTKEKGQRFCHWPSERLPAKYQPRAILQEQKQKFASEIELRRCVACGCEVTNENLGGHDGDSAIRGDLYCLTCADGRREP
jgi:hypothetical protein